MTEKLHLARRNILLYNLLQRILTKESATTMTFGETLAQAIRESDISISELNKKSGLARSMIYAIIDNKRRLTPKNNGRLISPNCFSESVVPELFRS